MKHALLNRNFGRVRTPVVLGVGRGGTSVIAGCLRALGVCMGRNVHPLKHEWSPVSYSAEGKLELDATYRAIASMDDEFPLWGWKSPRDFGLFESVAGLLREPGFILVTRDLLGCALSGANYQDMSLELALYEAAIVYGRIAGSLRFLPWPTLIVSYEDALTNPQELVTLLCSFLEIEPGKPAREQAACFIQPGQHAYRLFDAKPGDPAVTIAPEDLRMDAEVLAADVGRRYGPPYLERCEKMMAETRALVEKLGSKVNRTNEARIVRELVEQLCRLLSDSSRKDLPDASSHGRELQQAALRGEFGRQLRGALTDLLNEIGRAIGRAHTELDARVAGTGRTDFQRVYYLLQVILRVRAAVWRATYLSEHS